MKAALLTAPQTFQIESIPPPQPKEGEVIVRVKRAGVCGSDIHFYEAGRIGETVLTDPFLMGHEFSGVIEDACGVSGAPQEGARVAVDPAVHCGVCPFCLAGRPNICPDVKFTGFPPYSGAFAEYISIPVQNVYPMPDEISDDCGPLLETLAVAVHTLELMGDVQGKNCAVLGAGPVGMLTMLTLRHYGANVRFLTEPVKDRREKAMQLGCEFAFDPAQTDEIEDHSKRTTNYGPDIIFETAGEPESYQAALEWVRPGGTVCIIGIYPQGAMPLDFTAARRKEAVIQLVRRSLPHNYPEAIRLAAEGAIDLPPLATHNFPLERIGDAFSTAHHKTDGVIKALVSP
ncbi:MAG: alcohol dehydrogenase catalytic domain-containing protein [Candidatus Omnitrophica bacterium]|nr:alcohol dehydrogenase catalytic domain-containing protein [Candidatus Omnitrophota bacterium]